MSYQTCPLCNGFGIDPTIQDEIALCPVCTGKRIISSISGYPPDFNEFTSTNVSSLKPIYRGCDVKNCDCDGSCAEITGYTDI